MITVVKLGGSLLDLPDLEARWNRFVDVEQLSGRLLLLVGGGNIVEAVREYDSIHDLDAVQSHWLCVDLMNSTAQLLGMLIGNLPVLNQSAQLENWLSDRSNEVGGQKGFTAAIVAPEAFYSRNLRSELLPQSWDTTSDAIAAVLVTVVRAEQLILLKSTESGTGEQPLLDRAFQLSFADKLSWRTVNLRAEKYA